jgi:hypothetical protein
LLYGTTPQHREEHDRKFAVASLAQHALLAKATCALRSPSLRKGQEHGE